MDVARAFKTLDLPPNASFEDVNCAWRELIFIWHPDKHLRNPQAHKRALEKTKEINEAHEFLRNYFSSHHTDTYDQPKDDIYEEYKFIVCWYCGVTNRIIEKRCYGLRCGRCGAEISSSGRKQESNRDWNTRHSCGDGICKGIIGPDGRCTVCGRTWQEGRKNEKDREQSHVREKETKTSTQDVNSFEINPKKMLVSTIIVLNFRRSEIFVTYCNYY